MSKVILSSFQDFEPYIGKELGVSDYLTITQEQINTFADATLDHQWIHVDTEKAQAESPYKTTIAHGYLTVSLLPVLWAQIVEVRNTKLLVNYGIETPESIEQMKHELLEYTNDETTIMSLPRIFRVWGTKNKK